MAASSSSSSYEYDVFLSFRGEDTRHNFTSHLHAALDRKKVKTFIDDEDLKRGDAISPTLLNAIERSKISVVIFSKNYASSKWCLDELVQILHCHQMNGQMVIPVFYHVEPTEVRKQNGSFGDAFIEHEKHFKDMPDNKIQKWRTALTRASNLSGWATMDIRSEANLVDLIVSDILKKLKDVIASTSSDSFVGLNSRVEEIKSMLCIGLPDNRIAGIWGMGGIGKTTIAGAIFNQCLGEFEGKCFLANVREESEKGGLVYLRERILSEILGEDIKIGTPELPEYIRGRLRLMKVLIVLDDVNKVGQLEYLAGGIDRFGPGSRVIITTRDRRVLRNFRVCDTNIYEVRGLEYHDALELFCNYAFKGKHIPDDLLTLSKSVLKYANGNPLALRVLGSHFHQKRKLDLKASLEYLNQIPDPDIFDVLKISYNDLQQDVKSIFLDIACFFVGEDKDFVTKILDHSRFADYGLNVLNEKSLITISECDQIQMHDLLQEMGRDFVRQESVKEPGKRSRLWHPDDISHVLKKNRGTNTIEGVFLNLSKAKDLHLKAEAFAKMTNLRFLKFYMPMSRGVPITSSKVHLDRGLNYLPDELRYLHWHEYPLHSLPSNFDPENLISLELPYSQVDKIWEREKEAPKLTFMDLRRSQRLIEIPEPLEIQNLKSLNLSDTAIEEVPSTIGCLTSLKELDLSNCSRLRSLPTSISNLADLRKLNLHGNRGLDLESSLPLLLNLPLESLDLSDCALTKIPQDMGRLSSLIVLDVHENKLKSLPVNFGRLSSLKDLDLSRNNLESLPESIGWLSSLRFFNLEDNNLESLPTSIGRLSSLLWLGLHGNNFGGLPASMKQLSRLRDLILSNCNRLESLSELPLSLMTLIASNCKRLQSLPKVPSCLEELDASILERLPSLRSSMLTMKFNFTNCPDLDEKASNFLEDSQQIFQNMVILSLRPEPEQKHYQETESLSTLCVPGSKIPDWISNQSPFDSITIQLPLHCCNRNFIGFAVSVVIGGLDGIYFFNFVECDYCFEIITSSETKHVRKKVRLAFAVDVAFDSEHVLVGFCPCWNVGLPDDDDGDHHNTTVEFHFSLQGKFGRIDDKLISCGVCPIYLNAKEEKTPNSLTFKFVIGGEGECIGIRNSDDNKAGRCGASSANVGKSYEEELETL